MEQTIFIIVWVILAIFILFAIFTRKGRDFSIRMSYGGKVIEELGEVGQSKILLGRQRITLLKCRNKDTIFFVLETRTIAGLGIRYAFIKVDEEMLNKLNALTNFKGNI